MKGGYRPGSGRKKGSIPWNKGVNFSIETRQKMSESHKGQKAWNKGKPMSEKTKKKLSEAKKGKKLWPNGRVMSEETKVKISIAKTGKPSLRKGIAIPVYVKEKISKSLTGKKQTDLHRENNRNGQYARHYKKNPDYVPDGWLDLRKKRLKQAGGHHSRVEWENLKKSCNYTCLCCRKTEPSIRLTRDHIVPVSKGGDNSITNIQPLCHSCNCKKHAQSIKYPALICPQD
jgi:5-methylcytosine-specific restriction endonuclease McrA